MAFSRLAAAPGPVKVRYQPVSDRFCPPKLRRRVFDRDRGQCQYCGRSVAFNRFHVDHVVPHSKGGETVFTNLTTSCRPCNMQKYADEIPDELAPDTAWERPPLWNPVVGNDLDITNGRW